MKIGLIPSFLLIFSWEACDTCSLLRQRGERGEKFVAKQGDREIKWSTFVISSVIERSLHALRLVEMTKGRGGRDDKRVVETLSRDDKKERKGDTKCWKWTERNWVTDSTELLSLLPVQSDGAAVALTVFLQ